MNQFLKKVYPALTQSNFDSYIENSIQSQDPFVKSKYAEKIFESPNNFKNYVKAAKATRIIVDEQGNIHRGATYWSSVSFDGLTLPAQGRSKDYCKKWISYGCNNTKQHPKGKHYAEHSKKTCKTNSCPLCWVDWVNRQSNRSTRRFMKFTKNKRFSFRHIVLSPPQDQAKNKSYASLKKWLDKVLKIANIKTASVVFHPFRFHDNEKIQPYVSPHFHLLVYGKITNTTEFYNKTKWLIKNKGDLETELDIFNCVRYMLSHAGVRKRTHSIRYLGDISYRKLKVVKEPQTHVCPYCELPLTIFFIRKSPKSVPPPIDYVGLWEPSCFFPYYPNEDTRKEEGVPFYDLKYQPKDDSDYYEELLYSFEEILSVKTNLPKILDKKYEISQTRFVTSLNCQKLDTFSQTPQN